MWLHSIFNSGIESISFCSILSTYDWYGNSGWLKAWWKARLSTRQTPRFDYTANFPRHFTIFHLQIMQDGLRMIFQLRKSIRGHRWEKQQSYQWFHVDASNLCSRKHNVQNDRRVSLYREWCMLVSVVRMRRDSIGRKALKAYLNSFKATCAKLYPKWTKTKISCNLPTVFWGFASTCSFFENYSFVSLAHSLDKSLWMLF